MNEQKKDEIMKNAVGIRFSDSLFYFTPKNIDTCIEFLNDCKEKGQNYYIVFQGKKLYSLIDDENSCYLKVYGEDKETYKKSHLNNLRTQVFGMISQIDKFQKYCYPQRKEELKDFLKHFFLYTNYQKILDDTFQVVERLEKGEAFETCKKFIDENDSQVSMEIVLRFAKKGADFFDFMTPNQSERTKLLVASVKAENVQFKEELQHGKTL